MIDFMHLLQEINYSKRNKFSKYYEEKEIIRLENY